MALLPVLEGVSFFCFADSGALKCKRGRRVYGSIYTEASSGGGTSSRNPMFDVTLQVRTADQ